MPTATAPAEGLNPTLWRTCRVLANGPRLALLREVWRHPGQTVAVIATRVKIPAPLASRYLRELNARGLLGVSRMGSCVYYRLAANRSVPQAPALAAVLEQMFLVHADPARIIFRDVTAFTHPRRIEIVAALRAGTASRLELCRRTGISWAAVSRHVAKLVSRGLVRESEAGCELAVPGSPLAVVLLSLATGSRKP